MAEAQKDTIYVDIDDEITSIIDKVRLSKHKIVALVLPKRATVLQSIVNMKLLKRTSDETKKRIVLITSEAGLLPLAGAVGLYVAKTLHSKPAIPDPPEVPSDDMAVDEAGQLDDEGPQDVPEVDKTKPVGELAGDKKASAAKPDPDETIELDNDLEDEAKPEKAAKKAAKKGDKKLKVPNFNSFRKRIFLIGGAFVLLLILGYVALFVLPKATVTATTDNLTVTADIAFTASTSSLNFDEEKGVVPATAKDVTKTDTEKVQATGKKNVGEKASGTARFINCSQQDKLFDTNRVVPSGTAINSNGLVFITTSDVTVPPSGFNASGCKNDKSSSPVAVVAQASGDQYNLSSRSYTVSGFSTMTATGSDMTGGTNKEVKIVSQDDIDNVKQKLTEKSKAVAKEDLAKAFQSEQLFPLLETFSADDTKFTSSPKVGDEASEVTVTADTKFNMLGVKRDNLRKLVEKAAEGNIDTEKQAIANDGLDEAVFRLVDKGNGKQQKLTAQTQVTTGTQINEEDLKQQIKGKKRGDVEKALQSYPGVKDVDVKFSPFWVSKTPNNTGRITLVLEQAQTNDNNQ